MKAILFDQLGGPEVLKLGEVARPEVKPGWVLIKNHAIGINFADTFFRQGMYLVRPNLPDIPGLETAGVIEAVGPGVEHLKPGTRVAAIGSKTYAEYALASASGNRLPMSSLSFPSRMSWNDLSMPSWCLSGMAETV